MSTSEALPLFTEEEMIPKTFDAEAEDLVAELLGRNFVALKKQQLSQALRFYSSVTQRQSLDLINKRMSDAKRDKEYPQVYEPIIQIEAFEKARIPLVYKEDGEIESLLSKVMMYFFPGCTIERDDIGYSLHLNSVPFRRFSYFSNLVKENSSWVGFINENFQTEFNSNSRAQNLLSSLKSLLSERNIGQAVEKEVVFEETHYNYKEIIAWLPHQSSAYYDKFKENQNSSSSNFFKILDTLVQFSYELHFISDSYREINNAVNQEFEKEKLAYTEKQQQAVVQFEKLLKEHIVPVEQLGHKSAEAFAKANGIETVLIPFENKLRLTNAKSVGLSVYVREDSSKNQDWLIIPPTKEVLDFEGMEYQGVLDYVNFETTSYLATKQNAPHVVGKDSMLNTMIDEALFMQVLLDHYQDSPSYDAILASSVLLQKFPKAFAKVEPEKQVPASQPSPFSDWVSNKAEESETSSNPKGSLSDAMKLLKTNFADSSEETGLIQVGSLVSASTVSDIDYSDYAQEFNYQEIVDAIDDGLFLVEGVNLVEVDALNTVTLNLKHIGSITNPEFEEVSLTVNLRKVPMLLANKRILEELIERGGWDEEMDDEEIFNYLLPIAAKQGVEITTEEEDFESYFDESDGMSISDILDESPEPHSPVEVSETMPQVLNAVSGEFIYALNVDIKKLMIFKNKELIFERIVPNSFTVPNLKYCIEEFMLGKQVSETGISSERPFLLPIYNYQTGAVTTAVSFN